MSTAPNMAMETMQFLLKDVERERDHYKIMNDRLTAENARLREALERAAVNLEVAGFYDSAKSARQALKETE